MAVFFTHTSKIFYNIRDTYVDIKLKGKKSFILIFSHSYIIKKKKAILIDL